MQGFTYQSNPVRVVFGQGTRGRLAEEIRGLGCRRALVLSTPEQAGQAEKLVAELGDLSAGPYARATMHTPVDVTEDAVRHVSLVEADCLVAMGGGSTIGLSKAIAYRTDLPQIVIPTTYAGSEATSILGQTSGGEKTTLRSPKVLPEVILYDVDLTLTLPVRMTVVSGLNAIAHAVEALYAADGNPIVAMMAEKGVRALSTALPRLHVDPSDIEARSDALLGAWLCGTCLNAVSMGLHHKLCHTLGGAFNLPHAETHAIILPHALAYNAPAASDAVRALASALQADDPAAALFDLGVALGAPTSLASLGLTPADLERAADLAVKVPYPNPRPLNRAGIRQLLGDALDGRRPSVLREASHA